MVVWSILKPPPSHSSGRTGGYSKKSPGQKTTSPFHHYLEGLLKFHIDVQWKGRLNYINGYTTKSHDAMDFRLGSEFTDSPANDRWPTTYRLLCRKTVCIPEVALWFHEAEPMVRSFRIWKWYAPIAWPCDKKSNHSEQLYEFYFQSDGIQASLILGVLPTIQGRGWPPQAVRKDV